MTPSPSPSVPEEARIDAASQVFLPLMTTPAAVKTLAEDQLPLLAAEIRERMIATVSRTGGHLAPSLGTVELTLALCRAFDFPTDKVIWDVGHQSYAWKMLTGRNEQMETLRCFGGLRGFPHPDESPYDAFVGGHAGVALSAALGMAAARDAAGGKEHIIAVVGDASLTNGISLEALNAVRHTTQRLILVINDNGMSISRNVGAFSRYFARRLSGLRYNRIRAAAEATGHKLHLGWLKSLYRGIKSVLKPLLLRHRSAIFEDLGIRYIGPIDGHDIPAVTNALRSAAEGHVPVVLHIATVKGKGYPPAERHPSKWHGVSPWVPETASAEVPQRQSWSAAFGEDLCAVAQEDSSIVAITAAMRDGTGLADFFSTFPKRAYDVGICESHALAFAAGLATRGLRPVVALYSTFAQRAIDNMMHDVCLQRLPVVLCLDRAGVVGSDGPTHHGLYDIAMFRALPHLTLIAPYSRKSLKAALHDALHRDTPTVIRYPRGYLPSTDYDALPTTPPPGEGPVILALGNTVAWIADLADALHLPLIPVMQIKPLPDVVATLGSRPVITLEDAAIEGGFGSAVAEVHHGPHLLLGWEDTFIPAGSDEELRHAYRLDAEGLRERITAFLTSLKTL